MAHLGEALGGARAAAGTTRRSRLTWIVVMMSCVLLRHTHSAAAAGASADAALTDLTSDHQAAVDELVTMYGLEPHVAAAAIAQHAAAAPVESPALAATQTQQALSAAAEADGRRGMQEPELPSWRLPSWRLWDLAVLARYPWNDPSSATPPAAAHTPVARSYAALNEARLGAAPGCADSAATNFNNGADQPCAYECASLAQSYGFGPADSTCYIRDPAATDWPAALMSQKKETQDWFFFLSEQNQSAALETMRFDVNGGRACVNVTVQTLVFSDGTVGGDVIRADEVEVVCMLAGEHSFEHSHPERHNITASGEGVSVGYSSADIHEGEGGTTTIVVGVCEDAFVRVRTTAAAQPVVWTLDDPDDLGENHMGPWTFESPAGEDSVIEFAVCLFANSFSLSKNTNDWSGTVSVLNKKPDYSIELPMEGTVIVQGAVDENGVPQLLNARLTSGTVLQPSFANLVVRDVRFSGLNAPEDADAAHRKYSHNTFPVYPYKSLGAAVSYHGGWGKTIIFERCVFDHLRASSGAGILIDGLMGEWAKEVHRGRQDLQDEADRKLTFTVDGCLAWNDRASWVGGMYRLLNAQPADVTIRDSQFIDNTAFVGNGPAHANYPNVYDDDFDGPGMDGTSTWTVQRVECTSPNRNSGENVLHLFSFLYFPGWTNTVAGTTVNLEIDDLIMYDVTATVHNPGCAFYFTGHMGAVGAAGVLNSRVRNTVFDDIQGISTTSPFAGNAVYHLANTFEADHLRMTNSGTSKDLEDDPQDENGVSEGVLLLGLHDYGRIAHSAFSNLVSAEGGAVYMMGTASYEIVSCTFNGNVAWNNGGAVVYKGEGGLLVDKSQFVNNRVELQIRSVEVDVTVRVYTGAAGVFLSETGDEVPDQVLAIWKIDGATPDPMSGAVPANETVYGNESYFQQRTYSTTVPLTQGHHTLWHGLVGNTPGQLTGWVGNGWIDIVDIQSKVYPIVVDNRAAPDSDGIARHPNCYNGNGGAAEIPNMCPVGEAFWSWTHFWVPYGFGGAIASTGKGTLRISDSNFDDNSAGRGNVLSAIGPEQTIVSNSSVQADDRFAIYLENGNPQSTCDQVPCDPGTRCAFSRLSLFCLPCQQNEIGDGLTCTTCPPGTSPNTGQTECVLCPNGYRSSLGFCEACPTGKVSSSDRVSCVDCLPGKATGACEDCIACQDCAEVGPNTFSSGQQIECTPCSPGEQPNDEHTACDDCPAGRAGTDGSCAQCEAGTRPDETRASCQRCFGVGEFSADGIACTICPDGTEPNADVTGCNPCPVGTAGRLGVCTQCVAGTQPRTDRAECEECAEGMFSTGSADGLCAACEAGKTPNDAKTACESCGLTSVSVDGACIECMGRQVPNTDRSACVCKPGTYSQRQLGLVQCQGDFRSVDLEDECIECASCLNCVELGVVQSTSGWAVYGAPGQLYECPVDQACPPETFYNISSTLETTCAEGYTGPVCGDCEDGYNHFKVGQPCDSCIGNVINIPLLLGLFFTLLAVGGAVISGMANALRDHGIITDFRIIIGFYQLLSQTGNVLSMALPSPIPEFVGFIKLFFLDLRAIVRADCWDAGGLYYKLAINVFVVPFLFFFGCFLVYIQQKKTAAVIIAAGGADQSAFTTVRAKFKQNVFVGIFLLYPTMTSTLFRFPQCRSFGEDSFHEEDYSVDCSSSTFSFMGFITIVLIVLVPVGVPLGFLWAMRSKKTALGGVNTNDLGGSKLNEPDADDDDDDYSFLIKDYRPEFWYYEIITYTRKLLLGGLSVIMARGTMAQVYFVAALEAFFLCYHFRTYPFVQYKHNLMDGLGQLCLILTYVSCIVLRQTDQGVWSEEVISRTGYGYFICFLYVIVLPSPTLYYYFADSKKLKEIDDDSGSAEVFGNPLLSVGAPLGGGASEPDSEPSDVPRARMAKMQREATEAKSQTDTLRATVQQQAAEIEQLKTAGAQQVQLTAEERLAAEQRAAEQRAAEQAATAAELEAQHKKSIGADGNFNVRRFSQVTAMKEMVEGGLLSDEILQSAQQGLETHVHDGVLLQRKEMVRRQQREIDEDMKGLEKVSKTAHKGRTSMRDFLDKARLLRHEGQFLEVCGRDMAVEDLEFLGDEELKALKGKMTSVEGKRFEKALRQAQEGDAEA
jgi:hypothetical protein